MGLITVPDLLCWDGNVHWNKLLAFSPNGSHFVFDRQDNVRVSAHRSTTLLETSSSIYTKACINLSEVVRDEGGFAEGL